MPNVWVVRAKGGMYCDHFRAGGFAGVGWNDLGDLSGITTRDQITAIYLQEYPLDQRGNPVKPVTVRNEAWAVAMFVLDIQADDFVITPLTDTKWLMYGRAKAGGYSYNQNPTDGCPFPHRRPIEWATGLLLRELFSEEMQKTMARLPTAFPVPRVEEFFEQVDRVQANQAL